MIGRFQIANLEFSIEADDLMKLAKIQKTVFQIKKQVSRLKKVAKTSNVFIKVDEDLGDGAKSFDQMRLAASNNGKLYTIDFGTNKSKENNPLGYFIAWDKEIRVYDFETQEASVIDDDEYMQRRSDSGDQRQSSKQRSGNHPNKSDLVNSLIEQSRHNESEATISDKTVTQVWNVFKAHSDDPKSYAEEVYHFIGYDTEDMRSAMQSTKWGDVQNIVKYASDRELFDQAETFEPEDELPF